MSPVRIEEIVVVGQLGPWRDNHVVTLSETIVDEVVLEATLFETRSRELRTLSPGCQQRPRHLDPHPGYH